jgi:hypothetical protein
MNQQILDAVRIDAMDTAKVGGCFTANPFKISLNNKQGHSRSEVVISCPINNGGSASSTENPNDFDAGRGNSPKQFAVEDFVTSIFDVNVNVLQWSE